MAEAPVDPARDGHDEELKHVGTRRHTGRAEQRLSAVTNVATRRASSVESAVGRRRPGSWTVRRLLACPIRWRWRECIEHIINYEVPTTPDAYVHRVGRTDVPPRQAQRSPSVGTRGDAGAAGHQAVAQSAPYAPAVSGQGGVLTMSPTSPPSMSVFRFPWRPTTRVLARPAGFEPATSPSV